MRCNAQAVSYTHLDVYKRQGHSCGIGFKAAGHLRKHTEFAWQRPILRDMPSRPWTTFSAQ